MTATQAARPGRIEARGFPIAMAIPGFQDPSMSVQPVPWLVSLCGVASLAGVGGC
ncbi:hypothetical protein ACFONL_06280 [Camelimonas fluminis]|uniref:Uncharacterized protein n=1 Tax=Camelimonas fluminis TaxID=1576911 RepID=A0ABV7UFR0_9HYPH|nr:hypothetical protein [Camelimonas fluminis]